MSAEPRYDPETVLGTGTYGQVIRCVQRQTGERVAVKVVHPEPAYRRSALNEVHVLRELRGCNVVANYLDHFEANGRIHIVSELLDKNLYDVLKENRFKSLSYSRIRDVARAAFSGLSELHNIGYMHCDVKPENIMVRKAPKGQAPEVVLIDFGSVRRIQDNDYYDVQSLWYRAPEVICGLPYTPNIDAWSVGCLLYELRTGSPLFPCNSAQESLSHIAAVLGAPSKRAMQYGKQAGNYSFAPGSNVDRNAILAQIGGDTAEDHAFRDLLLRLLNPDEASRMSCENALNHPFVAPSMPQVLCVPEEQLATNGSLASQGLSITSQGISSMTSPDSRMSSLNSSAFPLGSSTQYQQRTPVDEWDIL